MCGNIRYEVVGEPEAASICHCASCRKSAGAHSVAWVVFPRGSFRVISGIPALYRSSDHVSRTFCRECGTTLTYQHDEDSDSIDVSAASLDDPDEFSPTRHVWLEDKLAWETVNDGLSHFERGSSDAS
ncbi:GFA family protein [soil metagenome]